MPTVELVSLFQLSFHNSSQLTTTTPTTQPQDPSLLLSPLSVSTSVINVFANILLPAIPAAFLYTVAEILGE